MIKTYIAAYVGAAVVFLAGDGVWLGLIARDFYRGQLGELMAPQPNIAAATAFYLLYVAGVVYFAVSPALSAGAWSTALISGLLLGLLAYATWDLTNLAVIRNFPAPLALVDMCWGAVLTGLAATGGYFAARVFAG